MTDKNFVTSDEVSTQLFDWGTLKWMSTPEVTGSERFSAGVVQLESGKGHDLHTHPDSDEILYFISGEGEQTVKDETREMHSGDLIYIPAGIEHGTINTGWETLKLLAIYAPPGPEDVLAELPECTILPPGELPTKNK